MRETQHNIAASTGEVYEVGKFRTDHHAAKDEVPIVTVQRLGEDLQLRLSSQSEQCVQEQKNQN